MSLAQLSKYLSTQEMSCCAFEFLLITETLKYPMSSIDRYDKVRNMNKENFVSIRENLNIIMNLDNYVRT